MPSFQSIVPSIVKREQIASGLALNSTQFNLSRILGPAIAGALIISVGAVGCFALNAASYVPFIVVALWILPRRETIAGTNDAFDRHHPFAGVRDITRLPHLRGALLTVFATSLLCAPLITFCPVLVRDAFHGDASHFSIAMGAFGIGGMVGAIGLLAVDPRQDRRLLSSWFAIGYGVILVLAALNPWFWGLPALMVLAGLAMIVSNISANTLLQTTAPAQFRGQTVSLYMLAMRGGLSVGSLLTGISVSLLGVPHALLINGVLAVVTHLVARRIWLRSPLPKSVS
jgi:predicted MFS family arabinose efflux permease